MPLNSPFFDFFDTINNEVENFSRLLDDPRFGDYCPRRQLTPAKNSNDKELQRTNNSGILKNWPMLPSKFDFNNVAPAVNLLEHENRYELDVTIPGVKDKKDINLEYHKEPNQIVVSGEIPSVVNEENKHKIRVKEFFSGKFNRAITLPKTPGIDVDNIRANYTNGILKLNVPKLEPTEPENQVKKIEISSKF